MANLSEKYFEGRLELYLDGEGFVSLSIHAEPGKTASFSTGEIAFPQAEAWCPENPRLYLLSAALCAQDGQQVDDLIDRVGFREIKTEGKNILLNGRKLRIKGFCRHEDHPQFGCSLPYAAMCRDLALMRDLGANSCVPLIIPMMSCFWICATRPECWYGKKITPEGFLKRICVTLTLNASVRDCIRGDD